MKFMTKAENTQNKKNSGEKKIKNEFNKSELARKCQRIYVDRALYIYLYACVCMCVSVRKCSELQANDSH